MISSILPARASLALALVGTGLMAGFFFAYQWSVLLGLDRVSDVTYVETFQAINDTIRNPWFGTAFFGTLPALIAALVLNRRHRTAGAFLAAALLLYIVTLAITFVGNIPLNDELGAYEDISATVATQARADFEGPWNDLNLLRTFTAIGALVCTALATIVRPAD